MGPRNGLSIARAIPKRKLTAYANGWAERRGVHELCDQILILEATCGIPLKANA